MNISIQKTARTFGLLILMTAIISGCSTSPDAKTLSTSLFQPASSEAPLSHEALPQETQTVTQQTIAGTGEIKPIPVLMIHYVRTVDKTKDLLGYNLSIDPKVFEKMMEYLSKQGYQTIHAQDILDHKIPQNPLIITFDDGYIDFYTTALPILQKYGLTASEAIITGKMDGIQYMTPQDVKTIEKDGIEILSHTVHHADLSKDPRAQQEIVQSKTYLEQLLGHSVDGFVYPSGKYNDQTIQYLKDAGYKIAFTTHPGFADLNGDIYQLNRIRVDNRVSLNEFEKKL